MTTRLAARGLNTVLFLGLTWPLAGCGDSQEAASLPQVEESGTPSGAGETASAPDAAQPSGPGGDLGSVFTSSDELLKSESQKLASDEAARDPNSAHARVPMAPDPKTIPVLEDVVWKVKLNTDAAGTDPSKERLTPLTVYQGIPVEFYEAHFPDGGLRLQGHRTVEAGGAEGNLHGPEWRWFENGQMQLRRHYEAGMANGRYDDWHESGFKKSEGSFLDDQLSGPWTRWSGTGALWKVQGWHSGLAHGTQWAFLDTGAVSVQVDWDRGKKSGVDHKWNKRGYPLEDSQWKGGKRHGHHLKWHSRQKRAVEKHFVDGKPHGPWLEWWPDGSKRLTGQSENGKRVGEWLIWSQGGVLITRENYANGEFHGEREAWSNTGIRIFNGTFDAGKPVGVHTNYFEGGGPKAMRTFSSPGVLGGPMTTWHPSGDKSSEGEMKADKRHGKWSQWNEKGKLLKAWSGTYENGERVGD